MIFSESTGCRLIKAYLRTCLLIPGEQFGDDVAVNVARDGRPECIPQSNPKRRVQFGMCEQRATNNNFAARVALSALRFFPSFLQQSLRLELTLTGDRIAA